jgi:hypothetical protein
MSITSTRGIPTITPDVTRDSAKLYQYLSALERQNLRSVGGALSAVKDQQVGKPGAPALDIAMIRAALQWNGSHPLNVEGLIGRLSETQLAAVLIVSELPPASLYPVGTVAVKQGSPNDEFYYNKGGVPNTWVPINTAPTNMVTTDTDQDITGIKTIASALGAGMTIGWAEEEFDLATASLTTTSSTLLLPGKSLIMMVVWRVVTSITGVTTSFDIGDATLTGRFESGAVSLSAGASGVGVRQWRGSVTSAAAGPTQTSSQALTVTTDNAPTGGRLRVSVFYLQGVST